MDERLQALHDGLNQLSDMELVRILDCPPELLLYDHCNYRQGRYCPLAVGLGIPALLEQQGRRPSQELVDKLIGVIGRSRDPQFRYNQMHGIPGQGYRADRPGDLRRVCQQLLAQRGAKY